MTKSVSQDHASPSSSFAGYLFQGPAQVAIRTRTNDQPRYVETRLKVWTWYDGGLAMKIDWTALQLNSELIEIGKGFMAYALEKYAPRTAVMFADTLRFLSSTNLATGLPWDTDQLVTALEGVKGLEFPRVMVILSDKEAAGFLWSYDKALGVVPPTASDLQKQADGDDSSLTRTRRLLYVTCSRAQKSLTIVYYSADPVAARESILKTKWLQADEVKIFGAPEPTPDPALH